MILRTDGRSDGEPCRGPLYDPQFRGEYCPQCHTTNYGITTGGNTHNNVDCACGWRGCQCELLEEVPYREVAHGKKSMLPKEQDKGAYLPTPEAIKRECEQLRKQWSSEHHRSRSWAESSVEVQVIDLSEVRARKGFSVESRR